MVIPCEPIVPETLWDECNRILDEQEEKNKRPTKRTVHLFTGIVFCECGAKMHVPSDGKKYICHACRKNRIAKDDLEEIYYENLKSFLLTDKHILDFLVKADTIIGEKELQLQTLMQEHKRVKGDMDKLIALHMSGELPKDGFGAYYNPLDVQLKQIENSIPDIQAEIDFLKIEHINSDYIMTEAQNLYDRWPTLPTEGKRQIVEQITDRITIGGDTITFKFSYNPAFFQNAPDSQRNFMGLLSL